MKAKTLKGVLEVYRASGTVAVLEAIEPLIRAELKDGVPSFGMTWEHPTAGPILKAAWKTGGIAAVQELFLAAQMITHGPKVFRPSLEQCLALEQVEPRLSVGEYRQPYPTMVVELPAEYAARLRTDCADVNGVLGPSQPVFVITHHAAEMPGLVCSTYWDNGTSTARTIHHYGAPDTIAGVLEKSTLQPPLSMDLGEIEEEASVRNLRVAVNALLLLTHYGHREEAENPPLRARLTRYLDNARRRGKGVAEAQRELRLTPTLCDFAQHVVLHETERRRSSDAGPTGRRVKFHSRRGHMRRQAHGEGNLLRKLIFIKPVFIHPEEMVTAPSVLYTQRS